MKKKMMQEPFLGYWPNNIVKIFFFCIARFQLYCNLKGLKAGWFKGFCVAIQIVLQAGKAR